jgi:hypothetical protein
LTTSIGSWPWRKRNDCGGTFEISGGNLGLNTITPVANIDSTADRIFSLVGSSTFPAITMFGTSTSGAELSISMTSATGAYIDVAGNTALANNKITFRLGNANSSYGTLISSLVLSSTVGTFNVPLSLTTTSVDTLAVNGSVGITELVSFISVNDTWVLALKGSTSTGHSLGLAVLSGTNNTDFCAIFQTAGGSQLMYLYGDGGLILGNPTGGTKGLGTLNVATGIYLNGTAYTSPDYVFDKYYGNTITGHQDSTYNGLLTLEELKKYTEINHHLPRIEFNTDAGIAAIRPDHMLEKVEEAYLYIFELENRVRELEQQLKIN